MELPSWGCEDTACSPTLFPHFLSWPPTVATPVCGEKWEGGGIFSKIGFSLNVLFIVSLTYEKHLILRDVSLGVTGPA